jgi:hypothetical protein
MIGEAATGGVVLCRITTADADLERGPSSAPLAAALLDRADEMWGTGTAGLTWASDAGLSRARPRRG